MLSKTTSPPKLFPSHCITLYSAYPRSHIKLSNMINTQYWKSQNKVTMHIFFFLSLLWQKIGVNSVSLKVKRGGLGLSGPSVKVCNFFIKSN